MPRAIWTGAINFGLVTIPIKLQTAVRTNELSFHLLHKKDQGRLQYARRCSVCGKEVNWNDVEKGYEYEKGEYVVLTPEDFKRADTEATQSVDIVEFVDIQEIDPMFFDKPYYLEPDKKGRHAYALLREALRKSGKVGIARVVIRAHEHIAALKPHGEALVLEMMHYADEIVPESEFDFPAIEEGKGHASEMKAATMLIDTMTSKFDPKAFKDTYKEKLMDVIEARATHKPIKKGKPGAAPVATNVVNLMDVLQKSLAASKKGKPGVHKGAEKATHKRTGTGGKKRRSHAA